MPYTYFGGGGDDDDGQRYAVVAVAALLADGFSSRLHTRLRTVEGLVYSVSARAQLDPHDAAMSTLTVDTTSDAANTARVIALVLDELMRMGREGITEDEFTKFHNRVAVRFRERRLNAHPSKWAATYTESAVWGRAVVTEAEHEREALAVRRADVDAVARRVFAEAPDLVVTYGGPANVNGEVRRLLSADADAGGSSLACAVAELEAPPPIIALGLTPTERGERQERWLTVVDNLQLRSANMYDDERMDARFFDRHFELERDLQPTLVVTTLLAASTLARKRWRPLREFANDAIERDTILERLQTPGRAASAAEHQRLLTLRDLNRQLIVALKFYVRHVRPTLPAWTGGDMRAVLLLLVFVGYLLEFALLNDDASLDDLLTAERGSMFEEAALELAEFQWGRERGPKGSTLKFFAWDSVTKGVLRWYAYDVDELRALGVKLPLKQKHRNRDIKQAFATYRVPLEIVSASE